MNTIRMRGVSADVRYVYHRAAQLGPWSLDGDRLTAAIVSADAHRLSQEPLTLVIPRPSGHTWRYALTNVVVNGSSLEGTVTGEA